MFAIEFLRYDTAVMRHPGKVTTGLVSLDECVVSFLPSRHGLPDFRQGKYDKLLATLLSVDLPAYTGKGQEIRVVIDPSIGHTKMVDLKCALDRYRAINHVPISTTPLEEKGGLSEIFASLR